MKNNDLKQRALRHLADRPIETAAEARKHIRVMYTVKTVAIHRPMTARAFYSALKEHWHEDPVAMTYPFPVDAASKPGKVTLWFVNGWKLGGAYKLYYEEDQKT